MVQYFTMRGAKKSKGNVPSINNYTLKRGAKKTVRGG